MRVSTGLALAVLALSASAHAKSVGYYTGAITAENVHGGDWAEWFTYMSGWRCSSDTDVAFTEVLADHKGRMRPVPQVVHQSYGHSFFSNPHVAFSFQRDMAAPDPRVAARITERCSKTVYVSERRCRTYKDSHGGVHRECRWVQVPYTKSIYMEWGCSTDRLPETIGQGMTAFCRPSRYDFGGFLDLESYYVRHLRDKEIISSLALNSVQNVYARDFCAGRTDNRVVIQLTQGAGGHAGEDDFVFHVEIDGRESFDLRSQSGVLYDEINYCGAGDRVSVRVTAVEKDLFHDDLYVPVPDGRNATVSLARGETGSIRLKRKSYTGATDRNHEIKVRVLGY